MTAINFDTKLRPAAPRTEAARAVTTREPRGLGACLARGVSGTVAFVFTLTIVAMYAYRGDLLESFGLAVFLASWLGIGFGVLVSGVLWDSEVQRTKH